MKILLLNGAYGKPGATSAIVANLEQCYAAHGHLVHILTTHRSEESPNILRKKNTISIPVSYRPSLRHYVCLGMPRVSKMITAVLQDIRPEAVHAHNVHTFLTYDALRIASRYAPVTLTLHDVMSYSFSRVNTQNYLDSEGKETCLSIADHLRAVGLQYNPIRNTAIRRIFRKYVRHSVAVSNALKDSIVANGISDPVVIHNAIDPSVWTVTAEEREKFLLQSNTQGRQIILFGGRISRDKGVAPLLQMINVLRKDFPKVLLLIAGNPSRWENFLQEYPLPRELEPHVRCVGWLDHSALKSAYAAADIVTTPSLCLDTFNMMNIEAMAVGKPVVGTIFGGTPEIVQHGITGFVCDPRSIEQYAGHCRTLLAHSQLAKTMGQKGRRRVEDFFTIERQAELYLDLMKHA